MEKEIKQILRNIYATGFLWSFFLLTPICSHAQNFFGISVNSGNSLKYSPGSSGLKEALTVSGSLSYIRQQRISSQLGIQFQGGLGVMGFNLKVVTNDTISTSGTELISPFIEYITFYAHAGMLFTKNFSIANRHFFWGLGGGATYYYCRFPTLEYGVDIIKDDNSEWNIFTSYMQRSSKEIFGFATSQIGLNLTKQLIVSLSYKHHFSPIYKGSYEFYHVVNPSKGNLYLYQREVNLGIFWKLARN